MNYVDYETELREALYAANEALEDLYCARDHLRSARNWGIFDIFGGGFIATLIKRRKMDNARHLMDDARDSLMKLRDELYDIDELTDLDLNMDDFVSFSDYFFDGFFFSDIMVQGRINDARSKLEDTLDVVERIRDELAERLNQL